MRVKVLFAVLLAGVAVVATGPSAGAATAAPRALPVPPEAQSARITDLNRHGTVVGSLIEKTFPLSRATAWVDGELRPLECPHPLSQATHVNDRDQVAGWCYGTDNQVKATVWQDGKATVVAPADAEYSEAVDINNRGEVLVWSLIRDPGAPVYLARYSVWRDGAHSTAFEGPQGRLSDFAVLGEGGHVVTELDGKILRWRAGRTTELARPANAESVYPVDVNVHGAVVGEARDAAFAYRVVVWQRTQPVDIGTLGGAGTKIGQTNLSVGPWINSAGEVAAESRTADGRWHVVRWRDGVLTDLTPDAADARAAGVNEAGIVAGTLTSTANGPTTAFVWRHRHLTELPALNPGESSSASALHPHRAQVAGTSGDVPVVWG
ncbi:hypothetical protein [Actinokineospora iranica]|uniref:Extracellular repeat, HAF family n=1 Tax=Actinokineospora iranica TaxID=1271860 RepID=A0A1G6K671_9PSEU|nr:hypothetical protein [Actinokineospora iranica]SDC26331.1 hypothetical protein SAMN05216174_101731 [Actinokineospora iranica]